MRKIGTNKLTRIIVSAIAVLVVVVGAATLYGWRMGYFGGGDATLASSQPDTDITMREDLMPNADSYYREWTLCFQDDDANTVSTAAYQGRPLVLLYWASWCPDCHEIMPGVDALAKAARSSGAEFALVVRTGVRDETAQTANAYLEENGITEPTLLDPDGKVYEQLGLGWVPTALFFNNTGVLMCAQTDALTTGGLAAAIDYADNGGRVQTEAFVTGNLLLDSGAVAAGFRESGGGITATDEVLSETLGLMMQYACDNDDPALFESIAAYLETIAGDGHIPWQVTGGIPAEANATLDDIRIIEALLRADALWGGYAQQAELYADTLYANCAPGAQLRDFSADGKYGDTLTLCYADVAALGSMAEAFPEWDEVRQNAQEILLGGKLGSAFPLYAVRYSYDSRAYIDIDFLQTNEAMVTVYNLARAGLLDEDVQIYLREALADGPIWAAYGKDGSVVQGYTYESTATYALLVMTACEARDVEMARLALRSMEKTRVMDGVQSPETGGYLAQNASNYSFDTVTALLAWSMLESSGMLPV